MVVITKDYPRTNLSVEELGVVENAIVDEISCGSTSKLQFRGIHFGPGFLMVECLNQETAEWLKVKVQQLRSWKGPELVACLENDIPKAHVIKVFLPKSAGRSEEFIFSLVEAQNEGLGTTSWKVLRSSEEGHGKLLFIGIDEDSFIKLKEMNFEMFFRFGKISVNAGHESWGVLVGTELKDTNKTDEVAGTVMAVTADSAEVLAYPSSLNSSPGKGTIVPSGIEPGSGSTEDSKEIKLEKLGLYHLRNTSKGTMVMEHDDALLKDGAAQPPELTSK